MKIQEKKIHPLLRSFFPVIDCVAELFGPNCEVVLHDVSLPEHSIIKISNGHVTGRKEGDSMTDLGLKMIKDAEAGLIVLGNYNPQTKKGRQLKSNAMVIKDSRGRIRGILCINLDVSRLQDVQGALRRADDTIAELLRTHEAGAADANLEEHFEKDLVPTLREKIDDTVKEMGKSPASFSPEDRQMVIGAMDMRGIFFMKNAVPWVAESLGISVPSVYRYLGKVRRSRQGA